VPVTPEPASLAVVVVGVFGVGLEVGRGRVEEQQIDLQVEKVGDGEEHRFLHLGLGVRLHQQVHRPIRLVLVHLIQPDAAPSRFGHVVERSWQPAEGAALAGHASCESSTTLSKRAARPYKGL
jgi:hypothetical protein